MAGCSPFNVIDNTENLDQEFSTFCKNLQAILTKSDEWLAMWKEAEQKSMEEHDKAIASYEEEVENLKKQIYDQDLRAKDMKDIIKRLENLENSKQKLESGVNDDQSKIKEENAKLEILETDVTALEKFVNAKEEKVLKGITFFKERLGLDFKTLKEDKIRVIFTKLDEDNEKRQFSFDTKIVESKYIVSNCNPPVQQLDAYVKEVNQTNDFTKFVVKMRKAFKSTLERENDQNISSNIM
ncbi:uncharacterized protein LOC135682265 isoform X2 [Rhopilema esculentum]|uniref:uncharacterized protein LOC135682265 isoform X2 n=1 Tax=Rhopilema esculentum TaxID=499914 RepID=UPI0031E2B6D3